MNWAVIRALVVIAPLIMVYPLARKIMLFFFTYEERQELLSMAARYVWRYLSILDGVAIVIHCKSIPPEPSIVIANHPSSLDNFVLERLFEGNLWHLHNGRASPLPSLSVPWSIPWPRFRNSSPWVPGVNRIPAVLYQVANPSTARALVIYPEEDCTSQHLANLQAASTYAMGAQSFRNLLYPRFPPFVEAVTYLRQQGYRSVLDITLDYYVTRDDGSCDRRAPTLYDIVTSPPGTWHVNVHVHRRALTSLPTTRSGLERWLEHAWKIKDKRLTRFAKASHVSELPALQNSYPDHMSPLSPQTTI